MIWINNHDRPAHLAAFLVALPGRADCGRSIGGIASKPRLKLDEEGMVPMSWHRLSLRIALGLLVVVLGMLLFCPKARSQDAHHGERLAKTWCVTCHSVDSNGAELRNEAVPSFSSIANDMTNSQRSLETYLNSSHPRMPAYGITRAEVRDLAAYIMSLRRAGGGSPSDRKANPPMRHRHEAVGPRAAQSPKG